VALAVAITAWISFAMPLQLWSEAPARLIVLAQDQSSPYGSKLPTLTWRVTSGSGSHSASFAKPPTCSTTASPRRVGTYPIRCAGAVKAGYHIKYRTGVLTVRPAPLTITALDQHAVYGAGLAAGRWRADFAPGDSKGSLMTGPTCATTRKAPHPVAYRVICSGASDPDYAIRYRPGILTVDPAWLTIWADSSRIAPRGNESADRRLHTADFTP
jgi:hypothetical protein